MQVTRKIFLFFVVLFILFSTSISVSATSCLSHLRDPIIILKPNPTIVVDFEYPVDESTVVVKFSYYPETETGERDFHDPVDKTSALTLLVESSTDEKLKYNFTEEVSDGDYYSIEVYAKTKEEYDDSGNLVSDSVALDDCKLFLVDFGPLEIVRKSPEPDFISDSSAELIFETSRRAECSISSVSDRISRMTEMEDTGAYIHKTTHPGSSPFYVGCTDGVEEAIAEFDIVLDTTPPNSIEIDDSSTIEDYPNKIISRNRARVKFSAEDSESGIKQINYTIVSKESEENVIQWTTTETIDDWIIVTEDSAGLPLQMRDRDEYKFVAKAQNNAGLWSELTESIGFEVHLDFDPHSTVTLDLCEEQGINCEDGHPCSENTNCSSGFCHPEEEICEAPSCSDGYKNGDQTDIDCGGSCPPCDNDLQCEVDSDCSSDYCNPSTSTCSDKPDDEPIIDRSPSPVEEEKNNFIMPILIIILSVGILGGGGYFVYSKKDTIMPAIENMFSGSGKSSSKSTSLSSQSSGQNSGVGSLGGVGSQPSSQQSNPNVANQLSYKLRKKEKERKREDLFGGFSSASHASENAEKGEEDEKKITKKDINDLFGNVK